MDFRGHDFSLTDWWLMIGCIVKDALSFLSKKKGKGKGEALVLKWLRDMNKIIKGLSFLQKLIVWLGIYAGAQSQVIVVLF